MTKPNVFTRIPPSPLTAIQSIRQKYLDRYDGGPPFYGPEAYLTYIAFLEEELAIHYARERAYNPLP